MLKHSVTKIKNRNSKYRLTYIMDTITKHKYFKFKKDITAFLEQIDKETAANPPPSITTTQAIKEFLAYKRPLISVKYYCDLVYILEKIKNVPFDSFNDQKLIRNIVTKLFYKKDGSLYSQSIIKKKYSASKMFLDYCIERGYLTDNYIVFIKKPRQYQRNTITSDDVYNKEEFLQILEHIPCDKKLFFALLFFCGLRTEEALGLKGSDLKNNYIYIRRAVVRFSKRVTGTEHSHMVKGLKHRAIGDFRKFQMPKALNPYLPKVLDDKFLFKPVMNYHRGWKKAVLKTNLTYHPPYSLRSSCITRWLEILPISEIAYRCGTSQEMILKVYGRRLNINQALYDQKVNEQNL